jgi:hypothetical protein
MVQHYGVRGLATSYRRRRHSSAALQALGKVSRQGYPQARVLSEASAER